jgi:hypothetical protein
MRLARALVALAAATPCMARAYSTLASAERPQHHRALEHHRLVARALGRPGPEHRPRSGRDEAVQRAQQHALARAVGAEHRHARAPVEHEPDVVERGMAAEPHGEAARLERESQRRASHGASRSMHGSRRRRRSTRAPR